jgi:hypothetical protein
LIAGIGSKEMKILMLAIDLGRAYGTVGEQGAVHKGAQGQGALLGWTKRNSTKCHSKKQFAEQ